MQGDAMHSFMHCSLKRAGATCIAILMLATGCGEKDAQPEVNLLGGPGRATASKAVPAAAMRPPAPDAEKAAKIRSALAADPVLSKFGIDVTVKGDTASLFGTVASPADRKRAATVTLSIEGVRLVDNQLKIVQGS
jgi:hypothetical protein